MTETKKTGNKKIVLGVVALVLVVALFAGIYSLMSPKAQTGAKTITIEVIDNEKASTVYDVNTDAEYLRQAMEEAEGLSFSGTESEYGLMIDTVNGVRADYTLDGAYWSFMVNGAYSNYGIDTQPVTDGDVYQIVYTSANE